MISAVSSRPCVEGELVSFPSRSSNVIGGAAGAAGALLPPATRRSAGRGARAVGGSLRVMCALLCFELANQLADHRITRRARFVNSLVAPSITPHAPSFAH